MKGRAKRLIVLAILLIASICLVSALMSLQVVNREPVDREARLVETYDRVKRAMADSYLDPGLTKGQVEAHLGKYYSPYFQEVTSPGVYDQRLQLSDGRCLTLHYTKRTGVFRLEAVIETNVTEQGRNQSEPRSGG